MSTNSEQRGGFTSYFGAVAAAVGSAVGLGNIWRFPYIAGEYGGGAFIMLYLIFVFGLGVPIMIGEFVIGRRSGRNAMGAFRVLSPKHKGWLGIGILAVITCVIIYSFYSVVAGWTIEYTWLSCTNGLAGKEASEISEAFTSFIQHPYLPILFQGLLVFLTGAVVIGGVQKGIEKFTKIVMPVLFFIMLLLCVRSLTLPGSKEGMSFLFKPEFGNLTATGVLAAMGQAIFSLSIGAGLLITYGSYVRKEDNMMSSCFFIASSDTAIALLAGIAIFPAVFTFGLSPASGPSLVFETLPNVFNNMPMGQFFAILFFVLLALAAITTTISLLEVIVLWVVEELHLKRTSATIITSLVIFALGALCSLSLGTLKDFTILGYTFFDACDKLTATYLMPIGALAVTIYLGWFYKKEDVLDEVSNHGTLKTWYIKLFYFVLRYIAPIVLTVILITGSLGIAG